MLGSLHQLFRHPEDSDNESDALDEPSSDILPQQPLHYARIDTESIIHMGHAESTFSIRIHEDSTQGCGGKTWDAARILCNYLIYKQTQGEIDFSGKRVLELGSGTGVVGLCIGALMHSLPSSSSSRVVLTDLHYCLDLLYRNIQLNFNTELYDLFQVKEVCWGTPLPTDVVKQKFDYILASECVYHEAAFAPLVSTLCELCPPQSSTTVYMISKKRRRADKRFYVLLRKYFDLVEVQDDPAFNTYYRENMRIYRANRK